MTVATGFFCGRLGHGEGDEQVACSQSKTKVGF